MANARDIELVLRARDSTRGTLQSVSKAVQDITARLQEQTAAASRGEASIKELESTLALLVRTDKELARQSGTVARFQELSAQLEIQRAAAGRSRDALQQLEASLAGVTAAKRRQNEAFMAARTASVADERALKQTEKTLTGLSAALEKAGIDTKNLAAAEEQLAAAAQRTGAARQTASRTIGGAPGQQRAIQAQLALLKEQEAQESQIAASRRARAIANAQFEQQMEARRTQRGKDLVATFTPVLDMDDAKEKLFRDLAKFRALAENAAAMPSTLRVPAVSIGAESNVAAAVERIVAPAQAARRTLAGLEEQVRELGVAANTAGRPIQGYADTLRGLEAAQRALVQQGGMIDAFRNQVTAVQAARAAFEQARTTVQQLAQQMRDANVVDPALASRLDQAKSAMRGFGNEIQNQVSKAHELRSALRAAGVDTQKLTDAELRLLAAAKQVTPAMAKLQEVVRAGVSPGGAPALFGLKPFQLQNLSFQINDVFTQLASGTSITQTLAQQGGQILQIFPNAFSNLLKFLPAIVAVGGAATLALSAVVNLLNTQAALRGFEGILAATTNSFGAQAGNLVAAQKTIRNYGASFTEAGTAIKTFLEAGLNPSKVVAFGRAAQNLIDIYGGELPAAAKTVASAFTSNIDAITELNQKYDFLSLAQVNRIRQLFDEGKAEEARALAFQLFSDKLEAGATQARGPWVDATRTLSEAWNIFLDKLGQSGAAAGFVNILTGAITALASAFSLLNRVSSSSIFGGTLGSPAQRAGANRLGGGGFGGPADAISGVIGSLFGRVRQDSSTVEALQAQITKAKADRDKLGNTNLDQAEANRIDARVAALQRELAVRQGLVAATTAQADAGSDQWDGITEGAKATADAWDTVTGTVIRATNQQEIADDKLKRARDAKDLAAKKSIELTKAEIEIKVRLAETEARRAAEAAGASQAGIDAEARRAGEQERARIMAERARTGAGAANAQRAAEESLVSMMAAFEAKITGNQKMELDQRLLQFEEFLRKVRVKMPNARAARALAECPSRRLMLKRSVWSAVRKIKNVRRLLNRNLTNSSGPGMTS